MITIRMMATIGGIIAPHLSELVLSFEDVL
jgi:hypothetical protein